MNKLETFVLKLLPFPTYLNLFYHNIGLICKEKICRPRKPNLSCEFLRCARLSSLKQMSRHASPCSLSHDIYNQSRLLHSHVLQFSFNVLYCTVLYCTVPYRTVPYRTVPYRTVPYRTVPYRTVLYCTVLYCTVLYPLTLSFYPCSLYRCLT